MMTAPEAEIHLGRIELFVFSDAQVEPISAIAPEITPPARRGAGGEVGNLIAMMWAMWIDPS